MYITDDGIKLNIKLDMPKGNPEKCPICVLIHGFTGHMEAFIINLRFSTYSCHLSLLFMPSLGRFYSCRTRGQGTLRLKP